MNRSIGPGVRWRPCTGSTTLTLAHRSNPVAHGDVGSEGQDPTGGAATSAISTATVPSLPATACAVALAEPSVLWVEPGPQPSSPHGSGALPQIHSTMNSPDAPRSTSSSGPSPAIVAESRRRPSFSHGSWPAPVMVIPARLTVGQPAIGIDICVDDGVGARVAGCSRDAAGVGVETGTSVGFGIATTASEGGAADLAGAAVSQLAATRTMKRRDATVRPRCMATSEWRIWSDPHIRLQQSN